MLKQIYDTSDFDYEKMYRRLYRIFDRRAPLGHKDCGLLCTKACCSGDDGAGMLLFPFEQTELNVVEKNGYRFAICNGVCDRSKRPLACRIFPFFPVIEEKGNISAQPDARGYGVCPLVRHAADIRFSKSFLHGVRKVGIVLSAHDECKAFLREVSDEIIEIRAIAERIDSDKHK